MQRQARQASTTSSVWAWSRLSRMAGSTAAGPCPRRTASSTLLTTRKMLSNDATVLWTMLSTDRIVRTPLDSHGAVLSCGQY